MLYIYQNDIYYLEQIDEKTLKIFTNSGKEITITSDTKLNINEIEN